MSTRSSSSHQCGSVACVCESVCVSPPLDTIYVHNQQQQEEEEEEKGDSKGAFWCRRGRRGQGNQKETPTYIHRQIPVCVCVCVFGWMVAASFLKGILLTLHWHRQTEDRGNQQQQRNNRITRSEINKSCFCLCVCVCVCVCWFC